MEILVGIFVLTLILTILAWHSNYQSTKDWRKRYNEYVNRQQNSFGSIGWKAFYNQSLLSRLVPALHEAGQYHTIIHDHN